MEKTRKIFAIVLLVLILPIGLLQMGIRNLMSPNSLYDFAELVETMLDTQLFAFDEVYDARSLLSSMAIFTKFFESLIIPFGIVASIVILHNATKKKITLLPGCVLLVISLFDLACVIIANAINNIEIIDLVADLLYYKNVDVNTFNPVINPIGPTINSVLLTIPAIGFLTCGIMDIIQLKKNPENMEKVPMDPKLKKARIFYLLSAVSVVAVLLLASIISAGSNVSAIGWIIRYFWQGYIVLVIAAIVFYIIGKNMNPTKKTEKSKKSDPVPISIQQVSSADELKKYKELLDQGIITQEEYDAKKKQLLGL